MNQKNEEEDISLVSISSDDEIVEGREKSDEDSGIELVDEEDDLNKEENNEEGKDEEPEDEDFYEEEEEEDIESNDEDTEEISKDEEENEEIDKPTKKSKKKEKTKKSKNKHKKSKGEKSFINKKILLVVGVALIIIIFAFFNSNSITNSNDIKDFTVKLNQRKIGDSTKYKIDGKIEVKNDNGIDTYKVGNVKVKIKRIELKLNGDAYMKIEDEKIVKNGFQQQHKTLPTKASQEIDLKGKAYTEINEVDLDGNIDTFETLFTDLTTNTTIQSITKNWFNLTPKGYDKIESEDIIYSYPDLNEQENFDFYENFINRNYKVKDKGENVTNGATIYWVVENIEKINNKKALKIHVTIDEETMNKNNLDNFDAYVWITNGYSVPIKIDIDSDGTYKGNDTSLSYTAILTDFNEGTKDISWDTCDYFSETNHFREKHDDVNLSSMGEYLPKQGTFNQDFNATKAIDVANKSEDFQKYLEDNPKAYVVNGFYNETDKEQWHLTFGEKGDGDGYYVVVNENKVEDEGNISFQEDFTIENSISDFNNLLTFSSAEDIFIQENKINNEWNGDFKRYNFGVHADIQSPNFNINALFFEATKIKYAYFLEKDDDSFKTAMDAENGRLIYIWKREGDNLPF